MQWLGITWDEGPYFQSQFIGEHVAAAADLLASGHAYKCFCSKEELERKRQRAMATKGDVRYDGICRRLSPAAVAAKEIEGIPYTIRMKVPKGEGSVIFEDIVYG